MADKHELLPCPFCDGEASGEGYRRYGKPLTNTNWEDGSEVTESFFVNCICCGIQNGSGSVRGYQTKAKAIAAWNTRPQPTKSSALADELEGLLDRTPNGNLCNISTKGVRNIISALRSQTPTGEQAMSDWQPIESMPWQTVCEVRNAGMEKAVLATRGRNTPAGVCADNTLCTTVFTPDAMFPTPAGGLVCPTEWRNPPESEKP